MTDQAIAMQLLQTLGLSTWNEETQTDDVDSSQVTEVLAAFDAARAAEQARPEPDSRYTEDLVLIRIGLSDDSPASREESVNTAWGAADRVRDELAKLRADNEALRKEAEAAVQRERSTRRENDAISAIRDGVQQQLTAAEQKIARYDPVIAAATEWRRVDKQFPAPITLNNLRAAIDASEGA